MSEFERLVELIESAGYEVRDYSGRGMFGNYCLGVSTDDDPFTFCSNVSIAALENDGHETIDWWLGEIQPDTRSDSLGLGSIYYWPSIKWENLAESED